MFSEAENQQVADLVRDVEARTSGEVAVVWTRRADDYVLYRGLWSLVIGGLLVAELAARDVVSWGVWLPGLTVLAAVLLYVTLGIGPVLRWLVPSDVQNERVHRRAQVAFLEFGVTETAARSGVLLFVSELEHRVEVIADRGITERVEAGMWQSVVDELISALRAGQATAGILRAIERIGAVLEAEFPVRDGDRNELGDAPRQF